MTTATLERERTHAGHHADQGDHLAMLDIIKIDRALVDKGGLRAFTKLAWPVLYPGKPLFWGLPHDAASDFIQAFIEGLIRDGILNVPPRMSKSTLGSVCGPAYSWIKRPELEWLTSAYRDNLSTRDSVRSRRLIRSPWYQERWGHVFQLTGDQNQKTFYENDKGGTRLAQSVVGGSTGEGGNRIIVDDPHNVKRAESDTERENALMWWDEEMSSRLNNPDEDGRLIIMQRLNENDLSGHCLAKGGYTHMCLPMEYEVHDPTKADSRPPCKVPVIGFEDPRTKEGELLEPRRFPEHVVEKLKTNLGPYAYAGQYQQRPSPRKGAMFDIDMIEVVPELPNGVVDMIRYWDKAGTGRDKAKGKGAHTAGVKMGRVTQGPYKGKFIILDVVRGQWGSTARETVIKNTAVSDGKATMIWIEQEPGSGGKESAEGTIRNLAGYRVQAECPTGDKVVRAEPLANQVKVGNVIMLKGPWNKPFIDEGRTFPAGRKDQIDGGSGAFNKLSKVKGGYTW
jgi:predicted phage terminase large subunit-like protein